MIDARKPGAAGRRAWMDRLSGAMVDFDWDGVGQICAAYVDHLRTRGAPAPEMEWRPLLALLRESRRYDELLAVADALLAGGVTDPRVWRAVGQGLVDHDRPAAALLVFQSLIERAETADEVTEAHGGIGRCAKEMFLATTVQPVRAKRLQQAYDAYRSMYDIDPQANYWHGINVAALLARAAREGFTLIPPPTGEAKSLEDVYRSGSTLDLVTESRRVAQDVLAAVAGLHDMWSYMTACEACIALCRNDEAVHWAEAIVDLGAASAFELTSLLRQLTQVWQLTIGASPGDRLLPLLRAELLRCNGGDIVLDPVDVRDPRFDSELGSPLERVFGSTRFVSLGWYRTGLARCRAVARIENANQDGIGTGFLVSGPTLHPDLPPLVLVTNAHVVPEAVSPVGARVVFHGLDDDGPRHQIRVRQVLWSQSSAGLDTTLLALEAYPETVAPVSVAEQLPRLGGRTKPRAYVIGHPGGRETPQFSLQDNAILDYDHLLLHYRSPTEHGSSGSPVFDNEWNLIGLHHAGHHDAPRLHAGGGSYAANEAIVLDAIRTRLIEMPPSRYADPTERL
jgi:hypothetical protein